MCKHHTWGKDFSRDIYYCDTCGTVITARELFNAWYVEEPWNAALDRIAREHKEIRCVRKLGEG